MMSVLCFTFCFIVYVFAQDRVLDHRHSFKAPFFLVRGAYLPYWEFTGSTVITEDYVRLTPAIKSRVGSLWNTETIQMWSWELEMEVRIGGGGKLGADGMALWYTSEMRQEGYVFGMQDRWHGLGIIFDTFDNDGMRDNPQIVAVYNDGTKEWRDDGKSIQFGGCHAQFRNPYKNIKAKVRNVDGFVEVLLDTSGNGIWEPCVPPTRLNMPTGYHLGVTAATGGLYDNHDVYSIETFNLDAQNPEWLQQQQRNHEQQEEKQEERQQKSEQLRSPQDDQSQSDQAAEHNSQPFDDILAKIDNVNSRSNAPPADNNNQQSSQPQQPQNNQHTQPQNNQPQNNQPQNNQPQNNQPQNNQPQNNQPQNQQYTQPQNNQQQTQPQNNQQQTQPQTTQQQPQINQQPVAAQQHSSSNVDLKEVFSELANINSKLQAIQNRPETQADVKQQLDQMKQQQTLLVEAMSNLLKNVVTRTDLDNMQRKVDTLVNSVSKEQSDNKNLLSDLKASVSSKVGSRNEDIMRSIEDINQNIKAIKISEEQTQKSTRQIAENLQVNAQDLTQTIHQSTSFGFWTYFLFVQAIFIFGYVWWRKQREDANKKLI